MNKTALSSTSDRNSIAIGDLDYVERSLAIACTRGREAVVYRFRDMLRRENLSEQQWRVLRILRDRGGLTSAEISNQSCIHKVSISRIVKSLEKRKIIARIASESDARSSTIALTPYGDKFLKPLLQEATSIHSGIASDLGTDKYVELLILLRELADLNSQA